MRLTFPAPTSTGLSFIAYQLALSLVPNVVGGITRYILSHFSEEKNATRGSLATVLLSSATLYRNPLALGITVTINTLFYLSTQRNHSDSKKDS